ncbi:hypothetical protein TRICI_005414 [Trichomonascus ciferrii]|uniref:VPS9 domain-containing protein n=1 Tax=Trichomonascus ciferrii TaxID=44093 RepID=A0A642USW7_9ASCO|nr:hypothetical protein TRICI_005414 [Trichomonascus ciferrii]
MMLVNLLNPLLNALFNHPSPSSKIKDIVHTISTSTGYTILVPQTDKLEWCVDKDTSLPFRDLCLNEDFIASHIIQVPVSSRNHQRARYLHTLNGRTVVIKDNEIFTHKGFKSYAKAKIVSEYLFNPGLKGSVPSDGQFVVYEIDTSLVGSPMLSKEVSPTISSRYQLLPTINEKSKPKKTRGVKIRDDDGSAKHNFETLLAKYPVLGRQLFGPLSLLIDNFDTTQCNSEEELLNALDNAVEVSIQIFQSGDTNVINSMVSENDLSGEDITDLLHVYVESYVCRKLWDRLVAIRKDKDEEIFKAASKIKNVDIAQIGLPPFARAELLRLDKAVAGAVREINKLPSCFGTDAKIDVLLSALNVLSGNSSGHSSSSATGHKDDLLADERLKVNGRENMNGSGEEDNSKISVNADILVSLMVLVLARSSLENLDSELFYIKNFTYRETGSGTLGYALLTLEGVLYHITHETDKLVELSSANEALWDAIKDKRDFSAHMETVKSAVHDWQSVFQSRTSSGESALMLAVQSQNLLAVQGLLALPDVMTTEYILSDKTDDQTTLLLAAVQSGNKEIINMLLERLDELPDEQQREYFAYEDQWKRSLGHYLFHAPWIIKRVGSYVDWNKKDINGQTPLFALCRCYDHPQYHELLDLGFQAWSENSGKLDVLEHIDNRGNTLLHIMKDRQALEKVMRYKVDVNWPNDRGLTPLMIYSKYSRMSAILLLRQNPQLDIERTDNRGLTALEIAKDPQTLSLLDGKFG